MENIRKWLENGTDYKKGVEIYKGLQSCNKMLLRQFERNETIQRKEKLIYELKKHLLNATIEKETLLDRTEVSMFGSSIKNKEFYNKMDAPLFHNLPPELRPVLFEANNLFKTNCLLKVELNEVPIEDEPKALSIMLKIDRNFKDNNICWNKINYWIKHRIIPKEVLSETFTTLNIDQLFKKQNLLNSSVSRLEKRYNENLIKIKEETDIPTLNRLKRLVIKQEKNALKQREELITIKKQIDDKVTGI